MPNPRAGGLAATTHRVVVEGTLDGNDFSGSVNTSTVFIRRRQAWQAVLHTESVAQ